MNDHSDLPLSASLDTSNTFILTCEHTQRGMPYSMCGHLVEAFWRGANMKGDIDRCRKPWGCGSCPAMEMRNKEIKAGRALYVSNKPVDTSEWKLRLERLRNEQPKMKMPERNDAGYLRGWVAPERQALASAPKQHVPARPKESTKKSTDGEFVAHDIQSLVTELAAEESAVKTPTPAPTPVAPKPVAAAPVASSPTKAESPLMAMARRLKEAQANG